MVFDLSTARKLYGLYPLPVMGKENSKYYEVHYDLLVQVHGRNLKVSIIYPPGGEFRVAKELLGRLGFLLGQNNKPKFLKVTQKTLGIQGDDGRSGRSTFTLYSASYLIFLMVPIS